MLFIGIFSIIIAVALPAVKVSPILLTRVASIILLYAAALSYNAIIIGSIGSGVGIFSGLFQVTSVSLSFDTFIFAVGAIILLPWSPLITNNIHAQFRPILEYSLIVLFTTCGASFLISSCDLVSVYLSIELQSFRVYILATLYRNSESATSAGLKYFLLGGLSSAFILLGSALIYSYTGLTNLNNIFAILSITDNLTINPSFIGFIIIVIGLLFKVSAAPFHNWAPDVYDGVPTIVTTWLAIMPKISIFILLLELKWGLNDSLSFSINSTVFDRLTNTLLISSLLSLIIGTVVGLAQTRIKRLLAYSTISHVGFLLLALRINSERSISSFLFYLIQYTITNLNRFLILLAFGYIILNNTSRSDISFISELKGQFIHNPLLGLALTLCLFSMRGVPPLIGFFGKQMVLSSALHSGYYFLSFVGIIVSIISASYYLKIVRVIHFNVNSDNLINHNPSLSTMTNIHSFTIASLTMVITLFMFNPSIILNSTTIMALTLFNY